MSASIGIGHGLLLEGLMITKKKSSLYHCLSSDILLDVCKCEYTLIFYEL